MHFCDEDLFSPVRSLPHVYEKSSVTCGITSTIMLSVWKSTILGNLSIPCTYSETHRLLRHLWSHWTGFKKKKKKPFTHVGFHSRRPPLPVQRARSQRNWQWLYQHEFSSTTVEAHPSCRHSTSVKYCLAIGQSLAQVRVLKCEFKNSSRSRGNV